MSDRFLRRPEVEEQIGLKKSALYELMQLPTDDPLHLQRPKRIGRRAVAWPESQIEDWKARRATAEARALPN